MGLLVVLYKLSNVTIRIPGGGRCMCFADGSCVYGVHNMHVVGHNVPTTRCDSGLTAPDLASRDPRCPPSALPLASSSPNGRQVADDVSLMIYTVMNRLTDGRTRRSRFRRRTLKSGDASNSMKDLLSVSSINDPPLTLHLPTAGMYLSK